MEKQINFNEVDHRYWTREEGKEIDYTSATTLLKEYVPEFNTAEILNRLSKAAIDDPNHRYYALSKQEILARWDHKSEVSCTKGTIFHKTVEAFLCKEVDYQEGRRKTKPSNMPATIKNTSFTAIDLNKCWQGFLNFRKIFPWKLYSSEETFFLEEDRVAGTPDAIFYDPNVEGGYIVVDWKTSKPLVSEYKNTKFAEYFMHPSLSNIPTLNYWVYALQVNLYAHMIKMKKGLNITQMVVLRFADDCNNDHGFEYYQMPDLQKQIVDLLQSRRQEKKSSELKDE